MGVVFRLAFQNLKEHKAKTTIISLFLIFGIAIVVMGNSFLESINRGLETDFRTNYTGDIAIHTKPEKGLIYDIFGVQTMTFTGEIPVLPAIAELDAVQNIVKNDEEIAKDTKLISAQVMLATGTEMDMSVFIEKDDVAFDDLPIAGLFAGEMDTYQEVFQGLNIVEGTFPAADTNEILVDTRVKRAFESIYDKLLNGESLKIGDTVLLAGATMDGTIREAKVVGFFKPANENSAMFQCVYSAPSFARSFANLTYASSITTELPSNVDLSLSSASEDDLFSEDSFDDMFGDIVDDSGSVLGNASAGFDDILGNTDLRDELNKTDDGAWHFILTKVENPRDVYSVIDRLNAKFDEAGLNVMAVDWAAAAYSYSGTVEGLGFIFNLLIIILAIVVFIIIMNTMTVSVIERTGEIGTMRAIGAEKKFVKRLFYTEAVSLTAFSAVIGIIFAFICMAIFNSLNITITNSIAKMILGGGLLHFTPTPQIIIAVIAIAMLGSVISNLYPVRSALKITPLKALSYGDK